MSKILPKTNPQQFRKKIKRALHVDYVVPLLTPTMTTTMARITMSIQFTILLLCCSCQVYGFQSIVQVPIRTSPKSDDLHVMKMTSESLSMMSRRYFGVIGLSSLVAIQSSEASAAERKLLCCFFNFHCTNQVSYFLWLELFFLWWIPIYR